MNGFITKEKKSKTNTDAKQIDAAWLICFHAICWPISCNPNTGRLLDFFISVYSLNVAVNFQLEIIVKEIV